jgi:hypothetical protein
VKKDRSVQILTSRIQRAQKARGSFFIWSLGAAHGIPLKSYLLIAAGKTKLSLLRLFYTRFPEPNQNAKQNKK